MNISIFGLGYVGAVSLACLARDGHRVIGVDVDQTKLDLIAAGKTPVVEEGMVDLMQKVVASGLVSVTQDAAKAMAESEISLVCVGTPSAANGSQDQSAMLRLAQQVGEAMKKKSAPHVFVFRSTLVPGTVEDVIRPIIEEASGKKEGVDFFCCFQPEFLREGSSIRDYDKPPFTIVGCNHDYPADRLRSLFGHLPCEFYRSSVRSAEMVKYCCNNFHALKITFANETARLCEALGVDPFQVMDLVCRDSQLNISKAYLKPGYAFGGSCLPKDLRATVYLGKQRDVDLPMHAGILSSNKVHVEHALSKVLSTGSRKVGFVGLSFKTGTDDLRESPLVTLAEQLVGKGVQLRVYDPEVMLSRLLGANRRFIDQHVPHLGELMRDNLAEVAAECEILVVGLATPEIFAALEEHVRPEHQVIDLVGLPANVRLKGRVEGLCW
ncbi:MAG: UDP-glucose/GDP-mannose dehydrogenase family protein [Azonexus sp.]|nr:UDP-glucose/GDP-mannose dehydrogenase family protein [Betaproteobacteria bacterium]MBK8918984.1 UDP-glucose/GDP-mannose dehydrogenase family protein [Betaproteobacteria bacterium]MBP6035799.1 UDP-glucose/GDP-mannose dehydrogenase family protein [Azonexus sp.]MBP6905436.1 UDP-glucose/GDP-mannose dehydrogenase family protein [Azonexus sp.]